MRIDLFAGAISSALADVLDLDRVCRDGLSMSLSRVGGRSPSESDVMAVEVDAIERDRRVGCFVCGCAILELRLLRIPFSLQFKAADGRELGTPTFFRRPRVNVRDM